MQRSDSWTNSDSLQSGTNEHALYLSQLSLLCPPWFPQTTAHCLCLFSCISAVLESTAGDAMQLLVSGQWCSFGHLICEHCCCCFFDVAVVPYIRVCRCGNYSAAAETAAAAPALAGSPMFLSNFCCLACYRYRSLFKPNFLQITAVEVSAQ